MALPDPRRAGRTAVLLTAVLFAAGAMLHIDRVPVWCSAIALLFALWRGVAALRPFPLPGRWARVAITIALIIAVLAAFRTLNGLAAGTAMLVVMGAVKLLETRTRRDELIIVFVSLFLLIAACLDRQSLTRLPLYAAHVWLACIALLHVAHPRGGLRLRESAWLSARSLLFALPLAFALFLFFPRIPGAFWALPKPGTALTGLSDSMSPGSITELVDSDEPAFRAWFEDRPPAPQLRYWRGPVLHDFDGYTWRRAVGRAARQPDLVYEGAPVRYRVVLEPDLGPWWFALELPERSPARRVMFTWDYQLIASESVTQLRYEAVSYPGARTAGPLSILGRRIDVALPPGRNTRTRDLAGRLRADAPSDAAYANVVLELFRTGGFEYTLTPPRLDLDSVDDFLFNTRRGFCGHFASAYVTMMRAGGVPARVVTGYLGGEWNPIGRYLLVKQSDAHAWTEVWLEGRGWTRIDPTGVVAPDRLTQGLFEVLPDAASASARLVRTRWLARARLAWDSMNAWWNDSVVGFDFRAQLDMLNDLGFEAPGWRHLGLALTLALSAWLAWVALHLARLPARRPPDRLARAYLHLCRKLARAGLDRSAHEGPATLAARLAGRDRDLAGAATPLIERYAVLRFGAPSGAHAEAVREFARDVARMHLRHTGARTGG